MTYIVVFPTIKVNVDQKLFGFPHSPKYILCSAQERNEYSMRVSKGLTIPLMMAVPLRPARI